ncbi:hypothetical protein [Microbacterium barkeri]|uniref:hypothetical protein n=1 Tax=Microbacterium barkeri TaxID=33917 RepID=UPI0024AF1030|nr:hypothetical protein [Microbacterium barkeri]
MISMESGTHHHPHLRERIREAGGIYEWANDVLIRIAGPAQLGDGPGAPCTHCGRTRVEHVERDGVLYCPED